MNIKCVSEDNRFDFLNHRVFLDWLTSELHLKKKKKKYLWDVGRELGLAEHGSSLPNQTARPDPNLRVLGRLDSYWVEFWVKYFGHESNLTRPIFNI